MKKKNYELKVQLTTLRILGFFFFSLSVHAVTHKVINHKPYENKTIISYITDYF